MHGQPISVGRCRFAGTEARVCEAVMSSPTVPFTIRRPFASPWLQSTSTSFTSTEVTRTSSSRSPKLCACGSGAWPVCRGVSWPPQYLARQNRRKSALWRMACMRRTGTVIQRLHREQVAFRDSLQRPAPVAGPSLSRACRASECSLIPI